jgi:SAM-dependent methyltransferase
VSASPDPALEVVVGRGRRILLPRRFQPLYWSVCARWWDAYRDSAEGRDLPWLILGALARYGLDPGHRVLDVGCGTGTMAVALTDAGYSVVGVDYARGMVERARAKSIAKGSGGPGFARLDFEAGLPFRSGAFDGALCIAALHCTAAPVRLLGEIARTLRPPGLLVLMMVGTQAGSYRRRTLLGQLFRTLRTLPGWRRRVQVRARPEVGALLEEGGFDLIEDWPVSSHLMLVARRRSPPTA